VSRKRVISDWSLDTAVVIIVDIGMELGAALKNSATSVRDVAKLGAPWGCHASIAKLREACTCSELAAPSCGAIKMTLK
jgi:hypothetical protein